MISLANLWNVNMTQTKMSLIVDYPVNQAQPVTTEHYLWPVDCTGKSYCDVKPDYYPTKEVKALMAHGPRMNYTFGNMENRDGQSEDVASCGIIHGMQQIYLIKDKNDNIRFVPQTDKFTIHIAVEECNKTGNVKRNRPQYLNKWALERNEVDCIQTMVPFVFPVLSRNLKSLESEAPRHGISLGCSGKILKYELPPGKAHNIMYEQVPARHRSV
ncbi:uncharacterized protein isoform X1 [Choristoneura fumiferana]|uniref:uncharacterized protein isoform X1 n=1 Tax=Choristoneura fumiferana TaxID=7141 RepID=UPI003D156735